MDDRRPTAQHPAPSHALSEADQLEIVAVCNEPRFAETPPARIGPALADEGIYIASEIWSSSRAACAWPDEPPWTRSATADIAPANHAYCQPSRR